MQFLQCKIRYLKSENDWISKQCLEIDSINKLMKEILIKQSITLKDYQSIRKKLQSLILAQNNNLSTLRQSEKTNSQKSNQFYEFCGLLFKNYDSKIQYLSDWVMDREKKLQQTQTENQKLIQKRYTENQIEAQLMDKEIQSLIKGYSPYPYILEHYRQKNQQLIGKHKEMFDIQYQNKGIKEQNLKKSTSLKAIMHPDLHTTIFQKATLCLKKKQYTNSILKNIIKQLKNKANNLLKTCQKMQMSINKKNQCELQYQNFQNQQQIVQISNISKIDGRTLLNVAEEKILERLINKDMSILDGIGNLQCFGSKRFLEENWDQIPILFQ